MRRMSVSPRRGAVSGEISTRPTLVKGVPVQIDCVDIAGQLFALSNGPLKVARLEDEWYEDLDEPEKAIDVLRQGKDLGVDLFTFWQRVPDTEPKYHFHTELEEVAALKISSYDHWWNQQIKSRIRTTIRKAEKEGLVVRETA